MKTIHTLTVALLLLTASCIHVPARTTPGTMPTIATSTSIRQIEDDPRHRCDVGKTTFEYHEKDGFMVGFVEFDDQGWFYNPDQFKVVREQIEKQLLHGDKETGGPVPAIIVAFVHGWRHSADVCDRDVVCFREVLRGLAVYEKARAEACAARFPRDPNGKCQQRKVAGVMLAWRGSPIRPRPRTLQLVEKLNVLSFYSRKSAAHQIGQAGYVASVVGWLHALDKNLDEHGKASRLVFAGHSFGGAMLFSAVSGVLNEQIAEELYKPEQQPGDCSTFTPRGVGNLVVLLNPAFEALQYHSINDAIHNLANCKKERPPIFLTLASTNDVYNRVWFTFGRSLSTAFDRFTSNTDQRKATISALGHYERFDTHRLKPNTAQTEKAPELAKTQQESGRGPRHCSCEYEMKDEDLESLAKRLYTKPAPGDPGAGYNPFAQMTVSPETASPLTVAETPPCDTPSCLETIDGINPYLPFKIIETDPAIVNGHSGIYNAKLIDFLIRSVATADHVNGN